MRILYKGRDGFTIEERLGDVEYFASILRNIARKYGTLSEPPDLEELLRITKIVLKYIDNMRLHDKIHFEVYPSISYWHAIISIAKEMIEITTKKLNEGESYYDLYLKIIEAFDKAEESYNWDIKTR